MQIVLPTAFAAVVVLAFPSHGQSGAVTREPSGLDRALLVAVGRRDLKQIKALVAKGANLDAEFPDHAEQMEEPISDAGMVLTPLMSAARSQDADVVRTLLTLGARPNHKGRFGETALLWAAVHSDVDVTRILLAWGAKPNDSAYKGQPVLAFAARFDGVFSEETTRLLIDKGADVNARDAEGKTTLMKAVDTILTDNVELLIRRHAALNLQDHRGRTALMYAAMIGSKPSVATLLAAGADVNLRDKKGWTALSLAQYAFDHGAPIEGGTIFDGSMEGDKNFVIDLGRVARRQYGGIVKLLRRHGAKPSPVPTYPVRRKALEN